MRNEKGFTLIEIIAVLIVLGILAAVAVPKYLDLQDSARMKAAQGAIAEMKGRASLAYAKFLLDHNGVQPAIDSIVVSTDVGADFAVASATSTNALIFTVSKVQEVTITNVVGTWTLPTT